MKLNKKVFVTACVIVLFLLQCYNSVSQSFHEVRKDGLSKKILDSNVIAGKLSNGLSYYIDPRDYGRANVEVWLVVKAGRLNEEPDQKEYAHLVEHMAFYGSTNFPPDSIIRFFEANGLKFGPTLNAATAGNRTLYNFTLPTNNQSLINHSLFALSDYAYRLLFPEDQIKGQAGAVRAELKRGLNTSSDRVRTMADCKLFELDLGCGNDLEERLIQLNKATRDDLQKFYNRWYRPNLMAVMVVGNVDTMATKNALAKFFLSNDMEADADIKLKPILRPAKRKNVSQFNVFTDTGLPKVTVELNYLKPARTKEYLTVKEELRSQLIAGIANVILKQRFLSDDRSRNRLMNGNYTSNMYESGTDLCRISSEVPSVNEVEYACKEMGRRLGALCEKGVSALEIQKALDSWLKESKESKSQVSNLINSFVYGSHVLSPESEIRSLKQIGMHITPATIDRFLCGFLKDNSQRSIVIIANKADLEHIPTEQTVQNWLLNPGRDIAADQKQFNCDDKLSSVKACIPGDQPPHVEPWLLDSVKKIILPNGIEVLISMESSSDFNIDDSNIQFGAVRSVGFTTFQGKDRVVARAVGNVCQGIGIGDIKANELQQVIDSCGVQGWVQVDETVSSIGGKCREEKLEQLFRLIRLYFEGPLANPSALNQWKQSVVINRMGELREIDSILGNQIPPYSSLDELEMIDSSTFSRVFKYIFSDPTKFTFFLTGCRDFSKAEKLVQKYFSCFKANNQISAVSNIQATQVVPVRKIERITGASNAFVNFILPAESFVAYSLMNRLKLDIATAILHEMIFARIRTKEAASYAPGAFKSYKRVSHDSAIFQFQFAFDCEASSVERLISAAREEVEMFKDGIFPQGAYERAVNIVQTYYKQSHSKLFMVQLQEFRLFNDDPRQFLNVNPHLIKITEKDVVQTIKAAIPNLVIQEIVQLPDDSSVNSQSN